jgi:predicted metal-dependent phosphoesterase TrpH
MNHEERAKQLVKYIRGAGAGGAVVVLSQDRWETVAQVLRQVEIEGIEKALEKCAKLADEQALHYFASMEGQDGTEFHKCEFAMGAAQHIAKLIRALKTPEQKDEDEKAR